MNCSPDVVVRLLHIAVAVVQCLGSSVPCTSCRCIMNQNGARETAWKDHRG